ncbi:MAG TPA: hypothetical protein VN943_20165 [Candidatus Acidoferrum sp.]|nr:hypothetical protein [Candidatus Acidoferrum sp.]
MSEIATPSVWEDLIHNSALGGLAGETNGDTFLQYRGRDGPNPWEGASGSLPPSVTRPGCSGVPYLPTNRQKELLRSLSTDEVKSVLDGMPPDDRTRFFEEMPATVTRQLLEVLSPEELKNARQLLGYPEHSVGRYMTPDYVAIRPEMTAAQVLEHIRKVGRGMETLNVIYILDEKGKLLEDVGGRPGKSEKHTDDKSADAMKFHRLWQVRI